ncbi:hypothetical protein BH09MYX1_BH09MYX1_47080 [soil metagenome]
MRRFVQKSAAALAAVTVVFSCTIAFADDNGYVENGVNGDQNVVFKDDPLAALENNPKDFVIRVPASPKRVMLLRPRTQFIQEMLKSVEAL